MKDKQLRTIFGIVAAETIAPELLKMLRAFSEFGEPQVRVMAEGFFKSLWIAARASGGLRLASLAAQEAKRSRKWQPPRTGEGSR